jgi:hypothetical protein
MSERNIGYNPIEIANMPEIRNKLDILANNAPGKLPTELDYMISTAIIKRMGK